MVVFALVREILRRIRIRQERFSLQWASAAEAPRFVRLATEFTRQIESLGPLGQPENLSPDETKTRLARGVTLVNDKSFRIRFGKATKALRKETGHATEAEIAELVDRKLGEAIAGGLG